jgi:hypothetical protein
VEDPVMTRTHSCALVLLALGATACGGRHHVVRPDFGIQKCPSSVGDQLLSTEALQCWFTAPNGRWRTLSHESHFAVLVVEVEAADIRDAKAIARRFVGTGRQTFSEILLYVQNELRTEGDVVRRIRWTADAGFETLDFAAQD